jgi:TonB family protein
VSRRDRGRLRAALITSTILHGGVMVLFWVASTRAAVMPTMRVYAVDIVSPPPQQEGEWSPEPVVPPAPEPTPEPEPEPTPEPPAPQPPAPAPPARREPAPAPPPTRRPEPTPPPARTPPPAQRPAPTPPPAQRPTPPRETPPAQRPPAAAPSTGSRPDPASTGGENLDLRTEGAEFLDPAYLQNIVRQVNRYFRRPGESRTEEAEVRFWINRDGSVSDIEVVRATGSFRFRAAAMEAVEQAGLNKAFGPLPRAYPADRLPVSFYFRPAR